MARNVVLVTVDSLRADHCGFINSSSSLTPSIDGIAEEAIDFTQAVAPGPRTPSSIPVSLTGEYLSDPDEFSMSNLPQRRDRIAAHMARYRQMSNRLQRQGYSTVVFTANPWTIRETNFHDGFDEFVEISAKSDGISSSDLWGTPVITAIDTCIEMLPVDPKGWNRKKEWFTQWTGFYDQIRNRLATLEEPFYVWIFLLDTHLPYFAPRKYREEVTAWEMYYSFLRYWRWAKAGETMPTHAQDMNERAYRDAVRSVDSFVETLINDISSFDPVTVFHSDHGEAFGEHGHFGHPSTLFEENLRVPLFVHNAGSSRTVSEQISTSTLAELVLDLVNPTSFDPEAYTSAITISQTEGNEKTAVRTPRWKYITDGDNQRLYDLQSAAAESTEVTSKYEKVVELLDIVIKKYRVTMQEKELIQRASSEIVKEAQTFSSESVGPDAPLTGDSLKSTQMLNKGL